MVYVLALRRAKLHVIRLERLPEGQGFHSLPFRVFLKTLSDPKRAIEGAVLDRFADMLGCYVLDAL